ncbi:inositol monophosphatase family protein [Streptomyces sp. GESEQ-4]|uniref:inositol monophosphatase family protein n=1 Tax=Streptomyces sp. GESEQ-4 TaxID=2812655 RepID=UPI001B3373CE|nr:inositol monophosphatase family protein [Streptomyces sp. GESEQ-4]
MTVTDDLDRALTVATRLAEWASEMIRRPRGAADGPVREKASPADIVTDTDEEIETYVRSLLRAKFPSYGIEGEEHGVHEGAADAPHWVIDPVDGTTNYAHGIGWCSFSLGLAAPDGSPLLGVVADPWRREIFTAARGRGAHLNGAPTHAADHTTLTGHVFLTEWAAHAHWPGMDALLAELAARHCTVRVMGSTALSLAQVAAGRASATAIGEFHPVDSLPALLIATEAGAVALPQLPAYDEPLLLTAPGVAGEAAELWRATVRPA